MSVEFEYKHALTKAMPVLITFVANWIEQDGHDRDSIARAARWLTEMS